MTVEIPSSFIISSRLSTLDAKDISKIVQLAQSKWQESAMLHKLQQSSGDPILAVGISNPQELTRVIMMNVSVIHVQRDCQALQAVQKKHMRCLLIKHRLYMATTASVWGYLGVHIKHWQQLMKRGSDTTQFAVFERGNIPIPNFVVGGCALVATAVLSWITKGLLQRVKHEYNCFDLKDEFLMVRKDVLYTQLTFWIKHVVPYCCITASIYLLKQKK